MKLRLVLGLCAVLGVSVLAASAAADPGSVAICQSAGTALSGTYGNLTITGNAYVDNGAALDVRGNLTLAPGSCLDAFSTGTVAVGGNVMVGRGATLGLGCSPGALAPPIPQPPCGFVTTNDTVGGNIIANHAYTMYLTAIHVSGNVISNGGGDPSLPPWLSFPIKENTIDGNLVVQGWVGAWVGVIRNHVGGNVIVSKNFGTRESEETGNPDSTEVQTNWISGNLICQGNTPPAQVNPGDGGELNVVGGKAIGECASLTQPAG
jgi:hypothetical protein